jgi:N-carbamoylputrescine amidase
MQDIRIAAVICNAVAGGVEENLEHTVHWARRAAAEGAGLVCFPEMGISGYCNRRRMTPAAQPVPGPASDRLCALAAETDSVILAGLAESDASGRIFASHLAAGPEGLLGVYRKVHIAPPEVGLFDPGAAVPVFDAAGLRFGIQLCYDAHFPELTTRMTASGVEVLFIPHASPRGTPAEKSASWMRHLPARAFDNGIFVAACNQSGENCNGLTFPGLALVLGPDGSLLGRREGGEGLLLADLKAADLESVRGHRMRYFFPNRRPEIYGAAKDRHG